MKCTTLCLLTIVPLIVVLAMGCSKKVAKVQPSPDDTRPRVEQPVTPPANENEFQGQEMDARMRETLVPIYFEYDKYSLQSSEMVKLEKVGPFLTENSTIRVLLEGHADERGSSEYNLALGENRARAIREWLTAYGLAGNRIETTSFGRERPATPNCPDEVCHSKNRRVEWKVLSK